MNVLVTGSNGGIGRYIVQDLVEAGYTVLGVDLNPPVEDAPGRYLRVDLTQAGEVYNALARAEADAVIHMGAWADAGKVPDPRTYGENVQGTFNIFQACADMGIKRIVSASSAQVYGFAGAPPLYAPVDEAHPLRPINSYALSKMAGEQAADYFVHNFGLTILSFRFMGVRPIPRLAPEVAAMAQNPAGGSWLLWTRTDARDAACACRQAIEVGSVEPGVYNITGAEVVLDEESEDLIRRFFGERTQIRSELEGRRSPLSIAKARAAFGYDPRYGRGDW
ncbi:MAG: NAD(P)-dependent oxidoreductase [Caldilineaceae bacterium]|nr:NAD(P)-dependent oxidoreductase [Caldilineaceae bacterium]